MRRLVFLALIGIGATTFIGADVFKSRLNQFRAEARAAIAADVPLRNQLAEARHEVDVYAESIIRGEVAAEQLIDRIQDVEREVRTLAVRVKHERKALAALQADFGARSEGDVVPARLAPVGERARERAASDAAIVRRARTFQATGALLERRTQDLGRLRKEHASTVASLESARTERSRLSEEITVLAAELESLEARKAAARTRRAVGESGVDASGYATAKERIDRIRASLREQNKLLHYYEVDRKVDDAIANREHATAARTHPAQAVAEALAAYPAR